MPTIDELAAAPACSDTDEVMVSQAGIARKATRAQLIAGTQPGLVLTQGSLVGRASAGVGGAETILIGPNLALSGGVLNAPAGFELSGLPSVAGIGSNDLVSIAQGGQNAAMAYGAFMSGMSGVAGVNGSALTVVARGTSMARQLTDLFADAVAVESFGAVGDGSTDDTAAFSAAIASGRPVRLAGKTYVISAPFIIANAAVLLGVPGVTRLTRPLGGGQSIWVNFAAGPCFVYGVSFDGTAATGADAPCVQVSAGCAAASFELCSFIGATGAGQGYGLAVSTNQDASIAVRYCTASDNALDGFHAEGAGTCDIDVCNASGNGGSGILMASGVVGRISRNTATGNSIGVSVGNWSGGSTLPPGSAGPLVILGNTCTGNMTIGIAVAATNAIVADNTVGTGGTTAGSGFLGRLASSRVSGNIVTGGGIGLDVRGCTGCTVADNQIGQAGVGVSLGGSQNMLVSGNMLLQNGWAIVLRAFEPTVGYAPAASLSLVDNWIGYSEASSGGIQILDGAQGVVIDGNSFNGWGNAIDRQALWLQTDSAIIRGNRWNNGVRTGVSSSTLNGLATLVLPDLADEAIIMSSPNPVQSIMTYRQLDTLGRVTFIRVTAGGSGYSSAQVTLSGSGSGATAQAIVAQGQIVGVSVLTPGSGYGGIGAAVSVTFQGDGTGASAVGFVGLPVVEGRRIRLLCNCAVQFARAGSMPFQENWTLYSATVPMNGMVDFEGVFGTWRAVAFPSTDYLSPTGDGGTVLRSADTGNVTLRPSGAGQLHLASDAEPVGSVSAVGRGSPLGIVTAPPGSDYRNLNGGAGHTLWIKQGATDASGWVAIA